MCSNRITNITHPTIQKLQLHTPAQVEKYLHAMRYLFDARQLLPAVTELEETARDQGWNEELEKNIIILTEK